MRTPHHHQSQLLGSTAGPAGLKGDAFRGRRFRAEWTEGGGKDKSRCEKCQLAQTTKGVQGARCVQGIDPQLMRAGRQAGGEAEIGSLLLGVLLSRRRQEGHREAGRPPCGTSRPMGGARLVRRDWAPSPAGAAAAQSTKRSQESSELREVSASSTSEALLQMCMYAARSGSCQGREQQATRGGGGAASVGGRCRSTERKSCAPP